MKNWAQNITIDAERAVVPAVDNLVGIIGSARAERQVIRPVGSAWSFSDCWAGSGTQVDASEFDWVIGYSQNAQAWGSSDVIPAALTNAVRATTRCFVHIGAGIKVARLIEELDNPGASGRARWTLRAMGGARGQTMAGAISTGTHGGDITFGAMADSVAALEIAAPDGTIHWIERGGERSLTDGARLADVFRGRRTANDLLPEYRICQDDAAFRAAVVSLGSMGVIATLIVEVTPQFGVSQVVDPRRSWIELRDALRNGTIFQGTGGIPWLSQHPNALSSTGASVAKSPMGVGLFINPYRLSDNYTADPLPNRRVMLTTQARADRSFDPLEGSSGSGPSNALLNGLVVKFEAAHGLDVVRDCIDNAIDGLVTAGVTRGFPVAWSVVATAIDQPLPALSAEYAITTAGGRMSTSSKNC